MAKVKGCLNANCVEYSKRTKFKENDFYCSKCGNKLVYVCPSCYKELDDRNDKFCDDCTKKKNDAKEKRVNGVKAVAAVALAHKDDIAKVVNKENAQKAAKVAKEVAKKVIKK